MAATLAPHAAPPLSWDKAPTALKSKRKKSNPLLPIAVAAIVALGGSGIWRATHSAPRSATVMVLTAKRDLPAGAKLGFTTVQYLSVPKQFATPDMVTSLSAAADRITKAYIPQGEPIKSSMLFSNRDGLSGNLENDERAITLKLNDDELVDHAIFPEDRVDVLAVSSKDGEKFTKTICQGARVLMCAAKDQVFAKGASSSTNTITLALTPDAAEAVTEAVEVGKIRLALRNRLSRSDQHLSGVEPADLLPAKATAETAFKSKLQPEAPILPPPLPQPATVAIPTPPLETPAPLRWMVEIFSGSHRESLDVPKS